jgi:outer membrane protein OmpA-like peptidoglycan-associated protein
MRCCCNKAMKFIVALFFMAWSLPCFADVPLPTEKPDTVQTSTFQNMIDNAVASDKTEPPVTSVNDNASSIILPPPLPPEKIVVARVELNETGIITPLRKPLHIRTAINRHVKEEPKASQDRVVIKYRGDSGGDNRMAGRGKSTRTYAQRRSSKLKETSDQSPFKTKTLPRAGKANMADPIILFFKEHSSDIEVGQLSVLKNDILKPMKRYKNKKAIIYGYAERNKKDAEKTHQLALARALIISDYLVDNRITDTRLEIRPMGDDTPISPKNRVDIVIYN